MNKYVKSLNLAYLFVAPVGTRASHHSEGRTQFICIALRNIGELRQDLKPYCHKIIDYINDCMGGNGYSLEHWLEEQGFIKSDCVTDPDFVYKMYHYRLAWIDELIRLYKGKKNDQ